MDILAIKLINMRRYKLLFLMMLAVVFGYSQSTIWHFGGGGGLRFNTNGTTSTFSGGATVYPNPGNANHTPEGSSVTTDANGNVIFYTNGKTIWDGSNTVISTSLVGGTSSTESSLIVPVPTLACEKFLVFTTVGVDDSNFSDGLGVALIDVNGTAPPYTVSVLGTPQSLQAGTYFSEKLTATSDKNGGWWVVAHDFGYNASGTGANAKTFYVYHITSAIATATNTASAVTILNNNKQTFNVTSSTSHNSFSGSSNKHTAGQGQMKFSKDGTKLGLTIARQQTVDLFDFNTINGQITFKTSFQPNGSPANQQLYGLEFSPNGNILYIAEWLNTGNERILQYDLNSSDILGSQQTIASASTTSYYNFSAMQLGVNDKIYIAGSGTGLSTLSSIDNPNVLGTGCNFNSASTSISGASVLGLPNVISGITSCAHMGDYTSINEENEMSEVSIYPNPSSGFININSDIEKGNYEVRDINGRILLEDKFFNNVSLNISDLANGIYYLTIKDGSLISKTHKIILNK